MNRKKCKVSGGWATTSNGKDSTVPCNDAVEVGEVVTMEHVGTSVVDLDEDGDLLDYLEAAWLLREKLTDFVEGGKGGPPGLELRSLLNMAASCKLVSVDSKKMSAVLWKSLPKELMLRVLARLPLSDITWLRSLSKEWNKDMATVNSEINRACDEISPTMVAGFSRGDERLPISELLVTICDLSTQRSPYSYRLQLGNSIDNLWNDMDARDGGLVCFVSAWRPSNANPLCIVVLNLLRGVQRKLPPLIFKYSTLPKMMHIKVNSATKCYRVVVIGQKNMKGRLTIEMYDSGAGQWTKATPPVGFLFGVSYTWKTCYDSKTLISTSKSRSVYDFAERQLKRYDDRDTSQGASVVQYVHHEDCMFVLLPRIHRKVEFYRQEVIASPSIVSKLMQRIGCKRGRTCALLWKTFRSYATAW